MTEANLTWTGRAKPGLWRTTDRVQQALSAAVNGMSLLLSVIGPGSVVSRGIPEVLSRLAIHVGS